MGVNLYVGVREQVKHYTIIVLELSILIFVENSINIQLSRELPSFHRIQ